ncbi:hypothetical protein R1sor_024325 [Riccia sorocarpa]|uniref:RNA helicase n=1 Tax=Riccia sorocarpa TaxID=122646 RepID=A0ABD3GU75_9MARC
MFVPRSVRAPPTSSSKPLRHLIIADKSPSKGNSEPLTFSLGSVNPSPSSTTEVSSRILPGGRTGAGSAIEKQVFIAGPSTSPPASSSADTVAHVPRNPSPELSRLSSDRDSQHEAVSTEATTPGSAAPEGNVIFDTEKDDSVVQKSADQRAAEADEPTCVVCGRYGEYICDETDDDVCSLECKAVVLKRKASRHEIKSTIPEAATAAAAGHKPGDSEQVVQKTKIVSASDLPVMQDDFIIVRDTEQAIPDWEPDAMIKKLTQQQVEFLRKEINLSVKGEDVPSPILEFSNCRFMPKLLENLEIAGYESPTPVQMQVIPAALKGRDILVSAGTGLGKTVGYLLSVVFRSCRIRSQLRVDRQKPLAIVLTPTRELCAQVEEQAKALARGLPFKTALVVGGDAMPQQVHRLKQGIEMIVATPGRLIDLLTKHDVALEDVCMLVLDEVDTMLDRGFRDQVLQIVTALTVPQILMFSATVPPDIQKFASSLLKKPIYLSVGETNLPSESVKQTVIWVETKNKKNKLFDILSSQHHFRPPVVVFVNSRMGAELLAEAIRSVTGLQAAAVHGEKSMEERREVMKSFLMGSLPLVVSTGVLGRGLDLLRVSQVIIFDMPSSVEEYIHQIGRASRLGLPGSAMVFVNEESKVLFRPLIEMFRRSGVVVPKELASSPYAVSSYAAASNPKKRKASKKKN